MSETNKKFGRYDERIWKPSPDTYGGRRRRLPTRYRAFIPDPIARSPFELGLEAVQAVEQASLAIQKLNASPPKLSSLEGLARQLLRAESLASSRIEGLELSHRRLALAAAGIGRDPQATEIVGNIAAMERSIELGRATTPFTVGNIKDLHRLLLEHSFNQHIAGQLRTSQNWIGGSSSTPANADFVPPPHEFVEPLLDDLCDFIGRDDVPALVQAAIAHAQFETIHPFGDGNGRVGRCLIHVVLRRQQLADIYVPPISLVLATRVHEYVGGLVSYREGDFDEWIIRFADAAANSAYDAERLADEIAALQAEWLNRFQKPPRAGSAARRLLDALPERPVLDVPAARIAAGGVSDVAAGRALAQLEEAKILQPVTKRVRGRVWAANDLFDLITGFERDMATPTGESTPVRHVPQLA